MAKEGLWISEYFGVPNKFYDKLCGTLISGRTRLMFDVIVRQTWGYNKKEARSMAKEYIKNYIKENKKFLERMYPAQAYNKAIEQISKNRVIVKKEDKEEEVSDE